MEMHQSVVEVGTSVCKNVAEVKSELVEMRGQLDQLAKKGGLRIVAASTHPFSDWKTQDISPNERYHEIVADLQDVARGNLIFGLHVHVGIVDREVAIALNNQVRYFLPHLLALTTSSPFWLGRNSGLMSIRSQIFKRFPRTGIPDEFESPAQFDNFVKLLIKTGCIDNGKKIWWDVRPHHLFDTVEVRICDMPTRLEHTLAVVALVQALMAKLYLMHRRNTCSGVATRGASPRRTSGAPHGTASTESSSTSGARRSGPSPSSSSSSSSSCARRATCSARRTWSSASSTSSAKGRALTGSSRCSSARRTRRRSSTG